MIVRYEQGVDERLDAAVAEMEALIRRHYPDATFEIWPNTEPPGLFLTATVDVEDTDEAFDHIVGRLLEMQVDDGLPLLVDIVARHHTGSARR